MAGAVAIDNGGGMCSVGDLAAMSQGIGLADLPGAQALAGAVLAIKMLQVPSGKQQQVVFQSATRGAMQGLLPASVELQPKETQHALEELQARLVVLAPVVIAKVAAQGGQGQVKWHSSCPA